jgi:hypothetical protein
MSRTRITATAIPDTAVVK